MGRRIASLIYFIFEKKSFYFLNLLFIKLKNKSLKKYIFLPIPQYLFLIIFLSFYFTNNINAQKVSLKITNQYNAKVDDLKIEANGILINLVPNAEGEVQFNLPKTDSIKFIAKNCVVNTIATNSILKTEANEIKLHKKFTWKDLLSPMFYIKYGGLWMLLFIIFAETGLFIGFFLPGDSLLFVAGIFSGPLANEFLKLIGLGNSNNQWLQLLVLITLVSAAGILGNFIGYWFGRKVGPAMFTWKDKFLFKKKYLIQAQEFYDKNGGGAIVIARFLPIIRTFAPIVAGIVLMPKAKFTYYNILGCIAWVTSMLCIGHFLDAAFPTLKNHLELIVIGIVFITTAPVLFKLFFSKKEKKVA